MVFITTDVRMSILTLTLHEQKRMNLSSARISHRQDEPHTRLDWWNIYVLHNQQTRKAYLFILTNCGNTECAQNIAIHIQWTRSHHMWHQMLKKPFDKQPTRCSKFIKSMQNTYPPLINKRQCIFFRRRPAAALYLYTEVSKNIVNSMQNATRRSKVYIANNSKNAKQCSKPS